MVSELSHLAFLVGLHTLAVSTALAKVSCLKGHKAKHSHQQVPNVVIYPGYYPLHHCHGAPALLCAEQRVFMQGLRLLLAVKGLLRFWGLWRLLYKRD